MSKRLISLIVSVFQRFVSNLIFHGRRMLKSYDMKQNVSFQYRTQEKARREAKLGQGVQAARRLENLATHLLASGERDLARAALNEAVRLSRTQRLAAEAFGGKDLFRSDLDDRRLAELIHRRGRMGSGWQSTPKMQTQDIIATLESVFLLAKYLLHKGKITLVRDLPLIPVMATYDALLMGQALYNLVTNAIQAMPEGGTLGVSLKEDKDNLVIIFRDDGEGIPERKIGRIFDPFFTAKLEGDGTSLGLPRSYSIVARHGGRIEVESEVGVGTTFIVSLPLRGGRLDDQLKAINKFLDPDVRELVELLLMRGGIGSDLVLERGAPELFFSREDIDQLIGFCEEMVSASRTFSLTLINIDRFLRFFERYGQDASDQILENLEALFRSQLSESAVLGRSLLDEFYIASKSNSLGGVKMRADQIRQSIRTVTVLDSVGRTISPVTVTIGLAFYPTHGSNLEELCLTAKYALFVGKSRGGDCIVPP